MIYILILERWARRPDEIIEIGAAGQRVAHKTAASDQIRTVPYLRRLDNPDAGARVQDAALPSCVCLSPGVIVLIPPPSGCLVGTGWGKGKAEVSAISDESSGMVKHAMVQRHIGHQWRRKEASRRKRICGVEQNRAPPFDPENCEYLSAAGAA
jgi:hypothetical protein